MMKKTWKAVAVTVGLAIGLCGCSGSNPQTQENTSKTAYAESSMTSEPEETQVTAEDAKAAFQDLIEQALDCVQQDDKDSLLALYTENTTEENIDNLYGNIKNVNVDKYPDKQYFVYGGNDEMYMCEAFYSVTAGTLPNTDSETMSLSSGLRYTEDGWKLDASEETQTEMVEILKNIYPEQFKNAMDNGRNIATFEYGEYSWVKNNIVIPGAVDGKVYAVWQNEDGSVTFMINVKNGSDEAQYIKNISFSLENESLGTIAEGEHEGDIISPNKSKNYVFTVDASKVNTDDKTWGIIHNSCNITW